nr:hypothetical protein [uncultured Methanobacterium sp.]
MIVKFKWLLIVFLFTCFLVMGVVSAANLTVSPGDSIQVAVDSASINDTILVEDNNGSDYTYTENLVVYKTVQLKTKTGGGAYHPPGFEFFFSSYYH